MKRIKKKSNTFQAKTNNVIGFERDWNANANMKTITYCENKAIAQRNDFYENFLFHIK